MSPAARASEFWCVVAACPAVGQVEALVACCPRAAGEIFARSILPPAALSTNLQGCSAFRATDHWHYITYGLSELYDKDPESDPDWSGWGFELTLRVTRGVEETAPGWPFTVLNQVANYINQQSVLIGDGHRMDLQQPITGYPHTDGPTTGLTIFAFTTDPQLGTIDTPNGRIIFCQAVGVTADEKARMQVTSTRDVLQELARDNPHLITNPGRA